MDEANETAASFRWVLVPSSLAFLILAIQQSYLVMTHTPRMLELFAGVGADLSAATRFAARWYWPGSVLAVGLTAVACCMVLINRGADDSRRLMRWYLTLVAGVIATLGWSAFVTSAMYEPIFDLGGAV